MARFRTETEIYDLWIENRQLLSRRYKAGEPPPAPTVREEIRALEPEYAGWDEDFLRTTYCNLQSELLRGGWQRVRDPDREVDYPDDPRDPELEAALRANPDDFDALAVYADLFLQHDHPRGQLMALEGARATGKTKQIRAQIEADTVRLRRAATVQLEGALATREGLSYDWQRGFIHRATLDGRFEACGATDLLFELFGHPSARFLRELVIKTTDDEEISLLVDLLLHYTPPPPLRLLAVHRPWIYPLVGEVGTLGHIYPQLEDVLLECAADTDLYRLAIPRCRRFALRSDKLKHAMLTAILDAPWPVLEELELRFGDNSDCTVDDLRLLLDGTLELPRIRKLRFVATPPALINAILGTLVAGPHASKLDELDFRDSWFRDNHVDYLIRQRDAFGKLHLGVQGTYISGQALGRLYDARLVGDGEV